MKNKVYYKPWEAIKNITISYKGGTLEIQPKDVKLEKGKILIKEFEAKLDHNNKVKLLEKLYNFVNSGVSPHDVILVIQKIKRTKKNFKTKIAIIPTVVNENYYSEIKKVFEEKEETE